MEIKSIEKVKELLAKRNDILYVAVQSIHSFMQQRIFQDGNDSQNRPLGKYSLKYARYREGLGRQTDNKDLNLFGDLERSFAVGQLNEEPVIGFTKRKSFLIADGQEGQVNRKIFRPTKEELNEGYKIYANEIQKILNA
jgi:hypothetical protein